jgi:hypothetical protein
VIALIILGPPVALLALAVLGAIYRPPTDPDPCPIHALPCPGTAGCVAVYQAECAAHGLPLLDTGGAG